MYIEFIAGTSIRILDYTSSGSPQRFFYFAKGSVFYTSRVQDASSPEDICFDVSTGGGLQSVSVPLKNVKLVGEAEAYSKAVLIENTEIVGRRIEITEAK